MDETPVRAHGRPGAAGLAAEATMTAKQETAGPAKYNSRGHVVNPIDLEAQKAPKPVSEWTAHDWREAHEAVRRFDAGER